MKRPDNRVVLGRGGCGKTYLVSRWLDQIGGRQIVLDIAAEGAYSKGAYVTEDFGDLVAFMVGGFDPCRVCWRGTDPDDFERVNELAWAAENLTLVWEEVDSFWRPQAMPRWAFKIVNQGRHRDIRVIACSRRPSTVSRHLTANASRIVTFNTREPRDVAYLSQWIGPEAEKLPHLRLYYALDWSPKLVSVKKSPFS